MNNTHTTADSDHSFEHPTMIVVLDGGRAKFFHAQDHQVDLVGEFSHASNEDTGASDDRPHDEKRSMHARETFFKEMAAELHKSFVAKKFQKLILVLPQAYHNLLEEELHHDLKGIIRARVQKDLVNKDFHVIMESVFEALKV